ncbi:MAG TPA: Na+/H+ antiporter NhaC family protein [Longimicrobiales bacterium]|nr:Na+/H+ antiporter NhaC family protein [Longimicrobiales bacterium]
MPRPPSIRGALTGAVILLAFGAAWLGGGAAALRDGHYGWASLLPALAALILVFATREVVTSLVFGVLIGGVVMGRANVVEAFFMPALATRSFALIVLVYFWALGGLIGLWARTGGAHRFAAWAGDRVVRGPRTAKLFTWGLGLVIHQGGTISAVLTGTTTRPVVEENRVSHEEASFLVDATASPVASIIPFNVWPLYVAGLVAGTVPVLATEGDAVSFFFRAIPANFYAIIAVLTALAFALEVLPWQGRRMADARRRARESGALDREGSRPLSSAELQGTRVPAGYRPSMVDFLVPLGLLIGVAASGVVPALAAGNLGGIRVPVAEAFALAVAAAFLLALLRGMRLTDAVDGLVDGIKGVTIGALVLGLAVTLGEVSRAVGAAAYLVDATAGGIPAPLLPAGLFALCAAVSFSIGSSFSTFAVVFPIALPLAWAVHPDPAYLALAFGAVVGGAVFGDQCSPISDSTILAALATGGDLMDHTLTQLPMALAGAALATILYFIAGGVLA